MKVVPNLLSIFRILLVPVFILAYFKDPSTIKWYAIFIYALASLSDFFDGYIARKFSAASNLGKVLDPLGDKLMMMSVMICITIDAIIPLWAVLVAGVKELCMGIGGYVLHKALNAPLPPANLVGKGSTLLFFLVCVALMIFRDMPGALAICLISVAIVGMLIAFCSYLLTYIKFMKSRKV